MGMARTEKEIDAFLSSVRRAWRLNPEQRLTQLIVNAINPTESCAQIFYVEDQKLADHLDQMAEMRRAYNANEVIQQCASRCLDDEQDQLEVASAILNANL